MNAPGLGWEGPCGGACLGCELCQSDAWLVAAAQLQTLDAALIELQAAQARILAARRWTLNLQRQLCNHRFVPTFPGSPPVRPHVCICCQEEVPGNSPHNQEATENEHGRCTQPASGL